jgi:predicted phosphodiesterase
MRYLILSDLHSNLEALTAVLAASEGEYDEIVCCGDIVDYGADPNAVVDWVRGRVKLLVRGNHDKACSGIANTDDFNDVARVSAGWTRSQLRPENIDYLRSLPQGPRQIGGEFAIMHGSPQDEDEYLPAAWTAAPAFEFLDDRVSFFGHTHLQGGFIRTRKQIEAVPLMNAPDPGASAKMHRRKLEVQNDETYLLNPGSVGQPRDGDNRAAFAIYDTDGIVEYRRAPYDIETAMKKILDAGLPEVLAYRLTVGR